MRPKAWKSILGWAAGGYAAVVAGAYALQRTFIYPVPASTDVPAVRGGKLHEIRGTERTVYALHLPAPDGAPTIVHFHGNGESLADQTALAAALQRSGVGVFAVEYPGYGLARAASSTEQSLYRDAEDAIRYLHEELGVPLDATVLQGQSLGAAVAVQMARQRLGARLVLIAPFTSMSDMVRRVAPMLPASLIVDDRYESHAKAPDIRMPVLIIHGTEDDIVPVDMGKRLADAFPDARLHLVSGAHHNDLFLVDGRSILDRIIAFARGHAAARG